MLIVMKLMPNKNKRWHWLKTWYKILELSKEPEDLESFKRALYEKHGSGNYKIFAEGLCIERFEL